METNSNRLPLFWSCDIQNLQTETPTPTTLAMCTHDEQMQIPIHTMENYEEGYRSPHPAHPHHNLPIFKSTCNASAATSYIPPPPALVYFKVLLCE